MLLSTCASLYCSLD